MVSLAKKKKKKESGRSFGGVDWATTIGLLLLCVAVASPDLVRARHADPIRLPVYRESFVKLRVGNPGRDLTLRLDQASNETLTLFVPPTSYSETVSYRGDGSWTDVVYVGPLRLRLPFRVDPSRRDGNTFVTHHGVLGLGRRSHLWHRWTRASVSASALSLGEYDRSVETGPHHFSLQSAVVDDGRTDSSSSSSSSSPSYYLPVTVASNGNDGERTERVYRAVFDPSSSVTRLPPSLYHHRHDLTLQFEDSDSNVVVELHLDERDMRIELPTNFAREQVVKQKRHGGDDGGGDDDQSDVVVLGAGLCRRFVYHDDVVRNRRRLCPTYALYDDGGSQPTFDAWASLLLVLVYVFWLVAVITERLTDRRPGHHGDGVVADRRRCTIVSRIEMYAYVAVALLVAEQVWAYDVRRYVDHHLHVRCGGGGGGYRHHRRLDAIGCGLFDAIVVGLALTIAAGLATAWRHARSCHGLAVRRCLVETTLVLGIWLCQVSRHELVVDHIFLIVVAAFHAVIRTVAALDYLLLAASATTTSDRRRRPRRRTVMDRGLLIVYALSALAFFYYYNALPFLDRFWHSYGQRLASSLALLVGIVGVPALYLFSVGNAERLERDVERLVDRVYDHNGKK